jgi:hypothetical protein
MGLSDLATDVRMMSSDPTGVGRGWDQGVASLPLNLLLHIFKVSSFLWVSQYLPYCKAVGAL